MYVFVPLRQTCSRFYTHIYTFLIFRSTTQYYFDVVVVAILQYDIFVSFRLYIYVYINISYISKKIFFTKPSTHVCMDRRFIQREKNKILRSRSRSLFVALINIIYIYIYIYIWVCMDYYYYYFSSVIPISLSRIRIITKKERREERKWVRISPFFVFVFCCC